MPSPWWNVWDAECARELKTYRLGWAPILNGRIAVVCWKEETIPQIILDRPLAEALMADRAGFLLVPAIRRALHIFSKRGDIVQVPMTLCDRRRRQVWAETNLVSSKQES